MKPGEIITKQNTEISLNEDRNSITLKVANSGDRPIQVGSHYHFAESNEFLKFEKRTPSNIIEIHNRPGYIYILDKKLKNKIKKKK